MEMLTPPCPLSIWIVRFSGTDGDGIRGGFFLDKDSAIAELMAIRERHGKSLHQATSEVDRSSGYGSFYIVKGANFRRYWVETLDYHDHLKYDLQNELIEGEKAKLGML
jgi:hypothetical protein